MKENTQTTQAPLLNLPVEELEKTLATHKLTQNDYKNILEILKRAPTLAELGVFSSMWSEHCSYKSSRVHLKKLPTTGPHVVMGPGENAGIIRLKDKLCLAFKMESHNHPSFIDPYQGAATGVGGILRDVFCMGARPVALLNALRFGKKSHPKSPWLCHHVVKGIGDYGNCVGIPTVGGSTSFDERYDGNILVNAMAVGTIHEDKIFTGQATGVGNLIYYVGAATGKDGIHGATMASDSFDTEKDDERSAVQVGDPFFEKLLLEATLEVLEKNLVLGLQDMGAAGLTSSIFEMASRAQTGVLINLNKVPTRTLNMTPYELMLSESQERMLMVIKPENKKALEDVFKKWDLAYDQIGVITDSKKVEAHYNEKLHIDIPIAPLVEKAPLYDRPQKKPQRDQKAHLSYHQQWQKKLETLDLKDLVTKLCGDKVLHEAIYEQYDHEVGLKTVLPPSSQGAAILEIYEPTSCPDKVSIGLTANCLEHYCDIEPKEGAKHSVYKTARTLIASGVKPLALTDCLNYGNPEDPEIMWSFAQSIEGLKEACLELGTPVISGNVSFYNETNQKSILPTPMIGMVGSLDHAMNAKPACSQKESLIYLVCYQENYSSLVGSNLAKVLSFEKSFESLAKINHKAEQESQSFVLSLCQQKEVQAIKDLDRQGILPSLVKMTNFKNQVETYCKSSTQLEFYLGAITGGYLVAIDPSHEKSFLQQSKQLSCNQIFKVAHAKKGKDTLNFCDLSLDLKGLKDQLTRETTHLF